MSQPEQPGTSADVPASQRRVTAQELTRALAVLRARKEEAARRQEEEARFLADTIPIGQSVEELSLEATPEEIWAEVLAQREQDDPAFRQSASAHPQSRTDTHLMDRLQKKTLLFVALACAASTVAVLSRNASPMPAPPHIPPLSLPSAAPSPRADPFTVAAPDAEFYRKLNLSQGPHPQYRIVLRSFWDASRFGRSVTSPEPTAYPLNAVPDGCTFYRPQFTGVSFGVGGPVGPTCVFEETGAGTATPMWMMTRYDGRYYQRTWIRRGDIVRLVQGNALDLYPTPSVQDSRGLTPLTLAVGSHPANCYTGSARNTFQPCFQNTPLGPIMQLPEGAKATLDSHAWEDFTAFPQREYQAPAWDKEPGTFVRDRKQGFGTADFDASSQVEPLQSVPDGEPVHCSSFTLDQMLHAYPYMGTTTQVLVDGRPHLDRPWTVINLGGWPYLRGWIADRPAQPLPIGRDLAVSSDIHAPEFVNPPAQITVPLNGLVWRGTEGGALPTPDGPGAGGKVIISNVRLDKHAWDKW